MATYKTPGIYIEEISKLPPSIADIPVTIPAFIGYTEKAITEDGVSLHLRPTRLNSQMQYEQYYGLPQAETAITVTAHEIADNNGNIVSSEIQVIWPPEQRSQHIMHYALQMFFANGGGACYVVSTGTYSEPSASITAIELDAGLQAVSGIDEITLLICPEAQALPESDYKSLHDAALQHCASHGNRFFIMDVPDHISTNNEFTDFRNNWLGDKHLSHGAAYAPYLNTKLRYRIDESAVIVKHQINDTAEIQRTLTELASTDLYNIIKQHLLALPIILPPSSAVAAAYVVKEMTRGIWESPANMSLNPVIAPTLKFTNVQQSQLNVDPPTGKSINVIKAFTGKGTLIWGARTLAGNDNEWRYISTVRFIHGVETAIQRVLQSLVFEPNDSNTWIRIVSMVENFLTKQWRDGALQGNKPEYAFFAKAALGSTMTQSDILAGKLILEIGLAPIRPAEFIIRRITQQLHAG